MASGNGHGEQPNGYKAKFDQSENKPPSLEVNPDGIPEDLKSLTQWVCWEFQRRQDKKGKAKWTKVPKDPGHRRPGSLAESTDKETWSAFAAVLDPYRRHRESRGLDGIGFVFSPDDPFVGVDLDDCRNPETGVIDLWAQEIISSFATYAEISPTGTGVKLFARGKKPGELCRKKYRTGEVEMYDQGRYFAVTGHSVVGVSGSVVECQTQVDDLYQKVFRPKPAAAFFQANGHAAGTTLSDEEIIEVASRAKNGEAFRRLWAGDITGYASDSEADQALANFLAFYVGNDPTRIGNLFRQSGLMRPKWDTRHSAEKSYGQMTVDKALAGRTEFYKGKGKPGRPKKPLVLSGVAQEVVGAANKIPLQPPGYYSLTDMGNAERLVHRHAQNIRWCLGWKNWLCWDKNRWVVDAEEHVMEKSKETVRSIYLEANQAEDPQLRESLGRHAVASESNGSIFSMMKEGRAERKIWVNHKDLDKNYWLLNCPNGVIDLHTGGLLPHDQRHLFTTLCPTEYHADAPCHRWEAFMRQVFCGDEDLIAYIQRFLGYCLTGDTRKHLLVVFYGTGSNGKGTLINTVFDVLGEDYAAAAMQELIMERRHGQHPVDIADLFGKRFVACQETAEGQQLNEPLVKWLTGGDKLKARRMHENLWDFKPTHKMVLGTNYRPKIVGQEKGIWRRVRLIPFEATFEGDNEDTNLKFELLKEAEGVLAWCVRGCLEWQRRKEDPPKAVLVATAEYRKEEDIVQRFLEECVEEEADGRIRSAALWEAFRKWFEDSGEKRQPTRHKWGKRLTELGLNRFESNGTWYGGIKLSLKGSNEEKHGEPVSLEDFDESFEVAGS